MKKDAIQIHIYEVNGEWVVADQGGWLPGSFKTPDEALKAAKDVNEI